MDCDQAIGLSVAMRITANVTDGKPIAVYLRCECCWFLTAEINNLSLNFDRSQSDVNVNSHIDLLSASIYYTLQLAMWIHYWRTQTLWIEIGCWLVQYGLVAAASPMIVAFGFHFHLISGGVKSFACCFYKKNY
jgi:hypothetical protein